MFSDHTCIDAINLLELVDQEIYLLSQKVSEENLKNLRKRIKNRFIDLAKKIISIHEINLKKRNLNPNNYDPTVVTTRFCTSCRKLKNVQSFENDCNQVKLPRCIDCKNLQHSNNQENCLQTYEKMLKDLRKNEIAR